MEQHFPAKKDPAIKWLVIVSMIFTLPVFLLEGIPLFIEIATIGIFAFVVWAWVNTETRIEDGKLVHQSGPIKWKVDISTIQKIKRKGSSLINHGTWSMDKMDIFHNGSTLSIAPENKDELIKLLKSINPKIEIT